MVKKTGESAKRAESFRVQNESEATTVGLPAEGC